VLYRTLGIKSLSSLMGRT